MTTLITASALLPQIGPQIRHARKQSRSRRHVRLTRHDGMMAPFS